jgi:hypothetical protein
MAEIIVKFLMPLSIMRVWTIDVKFVSLVLTNN